MSRAARNTLIGAAVVAAILVVGHWLAVEVVERWWLAAVAPRAAPFAARWRVGTAALSLSAVTLASLWFVAHLVGVTGAIGSLNLPRRLGGIEIREAIPPRSLVPAGVAVGIMLGIVTAVGAGGRLGTLILGWRGVQYGLADPVLGHDAGLYVAQLPLWSAGLDAGRTLTWVALVIVTGAYFALGALQVGSGGVAISPYARRHVGLLLALTAILSACRTFLGPLLDIGRVAVVNGLPTPFEVGMSQMLALATVGGATLIALWAWNGRSVALVAGAVAWILAIVVRSVVPAVGTATPDGTAGRTLASAAWGLAAMPEQPGSPGQVPSAGVIPIWNSTMLGAETGPRALLTADPVMVGQRPAWAVLTDGADSARLYVILDDAVDAGGGPVSVRRRDSLEYPGLTPYRRLDPGVIRPGAPASRVARPGVPLGGSWIRRLVLAWGTQAGAALERPAPGMELDWHLDPSDRVARCFPPASWGSPSLVLVQGEPYWVVPGYFVLGGFPGAPRLPWDGHPAAGVEAGLVGLVQPDSGTVRIFRRPDAGPVTRMWATLAPGLIEPDSLMPAAIRREIPYPGTWLVTQAHALDAISEPHLDPGDSEPSSERTWSVAIGRDTGSRPVVELAVTDPRGPSRLAWLLLGPPGPGATPVLIRFDPRVAPPSPAVLERRWQHFASWAELRDSIGEAGARPVPGPVSYTADGRGTAASQAVFSLDRHGTPALVRINLAAGERLGAGRTPDEARDNLLGRRAGTAPSSLERRMAQIRIWTARADSALASGDLAAFERAFGAIKALAGRP